MFGWVFHVNIDCLLLGKNDPSCEDLFLSYDLVAIPVHHSRFFFFAVTGLCFYVTEGSLTHFYGARLFAINNHFPAPMNQNFLHSAGKPPLLGCLILFFDLLTVV